jgi:hypothetical protein
MTRLIDSFSTAKRPGSAGALAQCRLLFWPRSGRKSVARGEVRSGSEGPAIASETPDKSEKETSRVGDERMQKALPPLTRLVSLSILSRGLRFARRPWLHSFRHYAAENKKIKLHWALSPASATPPKEAAGLGYFAFLTTSLR